MIKHRTASVEWKLENRTAERDALQAEVDKLSAALSAERAMRIKAEEVVDAVIKGTGLWGSVYSLAEEYRAQYPRVETK